MPATAGKNGGKKQNSRRLPLKKIIADCRQVRRPRQVEHCRRKSLKINARHSGQKWGQKNKTAEGYR